LKCGAPVGPARTRPGRHLLLLALLLTAGVFSRLSAQAPIFLPPDHWTRDAVRRMALLGALDVSSAVLSWPATRAEVTAWLAAVPDHETELAAMFRTVLAREAEVSQRISVRAAAGLTVQRNPLLAGTMQRQGADYIYPGPVLLADRQAPLLVGEVQARPLEQLAFSVIGVMRDQHAALDAAYLSTRLGTVDAWLGRRALALSNGLVLNQPTAFDGGGLQMRTGVRVPYMGRIYPELMVARMERSGAVRHPWFHAARVTIAPTPALAIGLNRAVLFGGDDRMAVTATRVLLMLIGLPDVAGKDSDFENQVASIDVLLRTQVANLPVGLYAELGADDSGWAFLRVPGVVLGFELGRLPGLPAMSAGVELVHLAERCCAYPPWYQHGALPDGWTDRGRLLGHALGGAGSELALRMRADAVSPALLLDGRLFVRERAAENLLSPVRQGRSLGGTLGVLVPWRLLQLQLHAQLERGSSGWQTADLRAQASVFFPQAAGAPSTRRHER
jgi:hypothetical protein